MFAGFSKEIITPSLGRIMAGYEDLRKSTGIIDDLHVRCIYLKQKEEVLLLSYDLLYVDAVFTSKLVDKIQKVIPIKKENIIISAIHTHSGPGQLLEKSGINKRLDYIDGGYDSELIDTLIMIGVKTAQQAIKNQKEAILSFSQRPFRDIGTNRNTKDAEIDDMLSVLEIKQNKGNCAILFSYACHPTILHEENTKYSCDLLGPAYTILEKDVEVAMFLNGACGDVSTRFTKQANSVHEVNRLGTLLAQHVQDVLMDKVLMNSQLQVHAFSYTCSTRCYMSDESLSQNYDLTKLSSQDQKLLHLYKNMRKYCKNQTCTLPIKVMKLDNIFFIYVPVELFSKLSLQMKEALKDIQIIFVSYAMDYFSYLPDTTAYQEVPIGFEAVISPFQKGCGEELIHEIIQHVQTMI